MKYSVWVHDVYVLGTYILSIHIDIVSETVPRFDRG